MRFATLGVKSRETCFARYLEGVVICEVAPISLLIISHFRTVCLTKSHGIVRHALGADPPQLPSKITEFKGINSTKQQPILTQPN